MFVVGGSIEADMALGSDVHLAHVPNALALHDWFMLS